LFVAFFFIIGVFGLSNYVLPIIVAQDVGNEVLLLSPSILSSFNEITRSVFPFIMPFGFTYFILHS